MFLHLIEEIGELARELFNKQLPMRSFSQKNLHMELAQVILDLFALANLFDIDLETKLSQKLKEMSIRSKRAIKYNKPKLFGYKRTKAGIRVKYAGNREL